ncbi:MAG TPA: methyltransferase domain-containing protein [Rudaea sp.]|jgi:phospholipid N-methyltransferase|nr:methyltransferase domain-containing protein [Rudaea sp.]HSC09529.1 methyltransferase domain-containing protein [Rhodanobacteraceae bacterium]
MSKSHEPAGIRTGKANVPAGWIFFRQWLKNPLRMAAFSPSGRQLARQMVAELPTGAKRVVELGGGTGVFTRAMIQHGIAPRDLLVLELNDELYAHLREGFPGAHVVHGNASELQKLAERDGYLRDGLADAAISGLGLLSMARATQKAILESTFNVLKPNGRLIQFTYGPSSPVPRELLTELGLQVRRGGFAWWNVPPASVYVYTRNRSEAIHAQRTRA